MPERLLDIRPAAVADARRLIEDDPSLATRIATLLRELEAGRAQTYPLAEMPRYGILSDCHKIYFGSPGKPQNTHRIVFREHLDGRVEVLEVVVIEEKDGGYVYLLAAKRLGRLPAESRPIFESEHQKRIARRGAQRKTQRSQEP